MVIDKFNKYLKDKNEKNIKNYKLESTILKSVNIKKKLNNINKNLFKT